MRMARMAGMRYSILVVLLAWSAIAVPAAQQAAPPPWKGKNLKFFPEDITREALTQRMREFSFALNVRCQYCHSGGDGVSFDGVDFASDDKTEKVTARAMLKMTAEINNTLLPKVPQRQEPPVEVYCSTCHRGLRRPKSLQTTLFEQIQRDGVAAAVQRYKDLRADMSEGLYDFGQWETMELARRLVEAKNFDAAIAILELTGEYYPKAPDVDLQIAEIHYARGEKEAALAGYRKTLEKAPANPRAKARIAELE